ncbi:MAG TPA: DUF1349 domain-containing protein [Pseudorhizobium sp.]|nr:DUF1349 domain-containing protein [Pseudorhizobium sp.]
MQSLKNGRWLNEPTKAKASARELSVTTDAKTDFWRETHHGFVRDNGHFYAFQAEGDFTAQVRIRAHIEHLYDQAGLMVRLDVLKAFAILSDFSSDQRAVTATLCYETEAGGVGR